MKQSRKNINKVIRIAAVAGAAASLLAAALTALSGLLVCKLFRYMNAVQKALPTIETASRVYLEQNAPERLPERASRRRARKKEPAAQ